MAALRKMHPRKAREFVEDSPLNGKESHPTTEGSSLIRRFRAGSVHFGCYAFRSAFVERCLDSGTLAAFLGQRYAHQGEAVLLGGGVSSLRAQRVAQQNGVVVAGGDDTRQGDITMVELSVLDAASTVSADHSCNMLGLIFAAHVLEDGAADRVSAEEAELLARTSYGLAYLTPRDCSHIARTYNAEWPEDSPMSAGCMLGQVDNYPRAGTDEGLLVENIWVLRERAGPQYGQEAGPFLPPNAAWLLHAAYGLAPALAARSLEELDLRAARLRYKRQVAAAVQACALAHCDGLLVGCAERLPGGEVVEGMAAEVWAEVLLGEPGRAGMASHFRVVAFCLGGRTDPRRLAAAREALGAAFSL